MPSKFDFAKSWSARKLSEHKMETGRRRLGSLIVGEQRREGRREEERKSRGVQGRGLVGALHSMASSTFSRWLRPEAYPLFAAVGTAVGICAFQLVRNITGNPEVRVTKENRAAGILDNFQEGERYKEHGLRKFVRTKSPEIMPSINGFFSDPK
ncbi:hypothetical protein Taro_010458 [Colocasia esculenta]|uniref:Uncharacterized protein n=1 Tax=Colocasia esculenta TaxID=4460 RepID=A0A843UD12_COLES|nr:hypothetical protein [Colocasia esculenta]